MWNATVSRPPTFLPCIDRLATVDPTGSQHRTAPHHREVERAGFASAGALHRASIDRRPVTRKRDVRMNTRVTLHGLASTYAMNRASDDPQPNDARARSYGRTLHDADRDGLPSAGALHRAPIC